MRRNQNISYNINIEVYKPPDPRLPDKHKAGLLLQNIAWLDCELEDEELGAMVDDVETVVDACWAEDDKIDVVICWVTTVEIEDEDCWCWDAEADIICWEGNTEDVVVIWWAGVVEVEVVVCWIREAVDDDGT